jgi:glycosyltransferase involved in cell wall biosynthesis
MLISIIIPNYNHGHYISDNLNGLLAQSYENWEAFVIDDGSTDNSKEIIEEFTKKDKRIKSFFLENNKGVVVAVNVGLEKISGELCYLSGADDYICNKDFFQKTIDMLVQYPNAAGVTFKTTTIDAITGQQLWNSEGMNFTGYISGLEYITGFFLEAIMVPGGGNIFKTKLFIENKYEDTLKQFSDYYLINALPLHGGICFVNEVCMMFRYSPHSLGFGRGTDSFFFTMLARTESLLIDLCNNFSINISPDLRRFWRNARMEWRFFPIKSSINDQDYLTLKNNAMAIFNNVAGELETQSIELIQKSANSDDINESFPTNNQIFNNSNYQSSLTEIGSLSLLDTSSLANLWNLAIASNPNGSMAEIGTFRGGSALHLTNACPSRKLYVFDPFSNESYESLDLNLDSHINFDFFCGVTIDTISNLLAGKNVEIHQGYFPESSFNKMFHKFSFVHLDVGSYHATVHSLRFLFQSDILYPKSYILINNYNCNALGINKALKEIKYQFFNIRILPLFPNQCLIIFE